jgi:hypothetical protein
VKTGVKTDVIKVKDVYDNIKNTEVYYGFDKAEKRKYSYKYFNEFVEKHRDFRGEYHDRLKLNGVDYKNVLTGFKLQNADNNKNNDLEDNETVDYDNCLINEL